MPSNRRHFLQTFGAASLATSVSPLSLHAQPTNIYNQQPGNREVTMFYDGRRYDPAAFTNALLKILKQEKMEPDSYGKGGAIEKLEQKFAAITGKEAAIFIPTGTMANQLAISVLSGSYTKVLVQEASHIYRDEFDAAQEVFHKRLVPLGAGKPGFTLQELKEQVAALEANEYGYSGIGALSIENPVRRGRGCYLPIDDIKAITAWCREKGIKTHLDGARIFIASAWTGIPVKEYASHFDTIYISLYKYLDAPAGAILCGSRETIDKMPHLVKVHGGNCYQQWPNAAMALHKLETVEETWAKVVSNAKIIQNGINAINGLKLTTVTDGTNIYNFSVDASIDSKRFREKLWNNFQIGIPQLNDDGKGIIMMNETLLDQTPEAIIAAFRQAAQ